MVKDDLATICSIKDFKSVIWLSYIGARTCYSKKNCQGLLSEKKLQDKYEMLEFLSKLTNLRHYSVFGHSVIYIDLRNIPNKIVDDILSPVYSTISDYNIKRQILALQLAANNFKVIYDSKYPYVIGISLRHYLESIEKFHPYIFENLYDYLCAMLRDENVIEYAKPWSDINDNVVLMYKTSLYNGYAVFYIDNISRIATHQSVRHTKLNFSQRSQRYVREDENYTIVPPSVDKEDIEEVDQYANNKYKDLVYNKKVKREDARFILPHGRRTTITVSGTIDDLYDFIEKRLDPDAQWEIRQIAAKMKDLLEEVKYV